MKLTTVLTSNFSSEIAIICTRLKAEGIECFLQDEINTAYSEAIVGTRLQVRESDMPQAIAILKEEGYLKDEDFEPSQELQKLHKFLSKIPIINKLVS